jgi:hypothetical protein
VNEYRVTKYNPAFRDQSDAYTKAEWTCFKDIGRTYSGVLLTAEEYQGVDHLKSQSGYATLQKLLDHG